MHLEYLVIKINLFYLKLIEVFPFGAFVKRALEIILNSFLIEWVLRRRGEQSQKANKYEMTGTLRCRFLPRSSSCLFNTTAAGFKDSRSLSYFYPPHTHQRQEFAHEREETHRVLHPKLVQQLIANDVTHYNRPLPPTHGTSNKKQEPTFIQDDERPGTA